MKIVITYFFSVFAFVTINAQGDHPGGFATDEDLADFLRRDSIRTRQSLETFPADLEGTFVSTLLFSDVDHNTADLIAANVILSDKNQILKASVAPLKFFSEPCEKYLLQSLKDNFRIQFAPTSSYSTIGLSLGYDNLSPWSSNAKTARDNFKMPSWNGRENTRQEYYDRLNLSRYSYMKDLNKNTFKVSVGYSWRLFPVLFSEKTHQDSIEALPDTSNYYSLKAKVWSLNLGFNHINKRAFTISYSLFGMQSRQNAQKESGKESIPYVGNTITINWRLIRFLNEDQLKLNETYLKSGFIPCIYIGITFESVSSNTEEDLYRYIENGEQKKNIWIPNIDFNISPTTQFRLSLPISKIEKVDGSKESLVGTTLQVSFKLSNLLN